MAASARIPRTRVDEVLDIVGLGAAAHRRIGEYSLGMKQRLGLATAMLGSPANLVLDEPMNGLDPSGVRWMRAFLRDAADRGHAVLVSSHLLAEMRLTADRVVVIAGGRLLGEWTTEQFLARRPRELLVHTDDDHTLAPCLRRLGVRVDHGPSGLHVLTSPDLPDAAALSRLCRDLGLLVLALGESADQLETAFLDMMGPGDARQEHDS